MDEMISLPSSSQFILPLIESLDDGFCVVDTSGRFQAWNLATTKILGKGVVQNLHRQEWSGFYGLHCPIEHRLLELQELPLARALSGQQVVDQEIVVVNDVLPQPRWIRVQARPLMDSDKNIVAAVAFIRDVTGEKASLLASQMMDWFFTSSDDGIFGVNMYGTILLWSPGAVKLFGWESEEIIGRSVYRLVPPDRRHEVDLLFEKAKQNQQLPPREGYLVSKDGREVPVLRSITVIRDTQGRVNGGVVVARDISELKKAEEELAQSREQLRLLSARQQNLLEEQLRALARELHDEFGQQLAGMKFELAWLEKRLLSESPVYEERLASLNLLLDSTIAGLRRVSKQMRPPLLEELGLCHAVDEMLAELASRYSLKIHYLCPNPQLHFTPDAGLAIFRLIQEALTNVIRHAGAKTVEVEITQLQGRLVVQVRDDGKGLPTFPLTPSPGFGILGMQERARSWAGQVQVFSPPQGGTVVEANFPSSRVLSGS